MERLQEKVWEIFPPTDEQREAFKRKMELFESRSELQGPGGELGVAPGQLTVDPRQYDIPPEQRWDMIKFRLNENTFRGLKDLWYPEKGKPSQPLTDPQKNLLRQIFQNFAFGETNFETWYKQTLKRLEANSR
jgi:hypothetical protein